MQLDQLRYFVAVAEELHFRRAAERLHISQPPLSFHIKSLEREMGTRLLNRSTRSVSLTEAGSVFLIRAKTILSEVIEAADEVKGIAQGRAGLLRIGFTVSTSFHPFFYESVYRYRRAHPRVMVKLSEKVSERQIDALLSGQLDVGFLRGRFDRVAGLTMHTLTRDALMLAVHRSHSIASATAVSLASLRSEPFISYPANAGVGVYRQILTLCERAGFEPRVVQEALEPSVIIGLVAAGLGMAIVPSSLKNIRIPDVFFVPIADAGALTALYVVHCTNDSNPRVRAFTDLVLRACKALEPDQILSRALPASGTSRRKSK